MKRALPFFSLVKGSTLHHPVDSLNPFSRTGEAERSRQQPLTEREQSTLPLVPQGHGRAPIPGGVTAVTQAKATERLASIRRPTNVSPGQAVAPGTKGSTGEEASDPGGPLRALDMPRTSQAAEEEAAVAGSCFHFVAIGSTKFSPTRGPQRRNPTTREAVCDSSPLFVREVALLSLAGGSPGMVPSSSPYCGGVHLVVLAGRTGGKP
ncbi:hypothetical protein NDU88_006062 [Pleurodeles waltl]|uniref:Uncharacterized protein n=1 Tax=Pleurodeles waltl TaxID=8319 RepID=A0AAV7MBU5_PLEWA|nr:hypothetical protein NDU88_006062 [Pleurodeles waltl]